MRSDDVRRLFIFHGKANRIMSNDHDFLCMLFTL